MSADNAYFVIHRHENGEDVWSVAHGFMSPWVEQGTEYDPNFNYAQSLFDKGQKYTDRALALEDAHDSANEDYIVEYGVVEAELPPNESVALWATEKEREQAEIRRVVAEVSQRYETA